VIATVQKTVAARSKLIAPKPFQGLEGDIEKADLWLDKFQTFAKLKGNGIPSQLQLFKLYMVDDAADWLRTLPTSVRMNLHKLYGEFTKRFSLSDLDRWKKASAIWTREQGANESVDKFVTEIKSAARIVPTTDETFLRFAIIRGLRDCTYAYRHIRLHVLQSGVASIDDVIKAVRVTETAHTVN